MVDAAKVVDSEKLLTRDELSLLLFLETRAVDYGGRVATPHMNDDDRTIVDRWVEEGYVEYGRIALEDHNKQGTHWVKLSAEALKAAHQERTARIDRMWAARRFKTTAEKRAE